MLETIGVTHWFDVSKPWLQRILSGGQRLSLRAVDDVSFRIERGTTLSLVGESGCGKSTIARLAVGLYPPSAGEIRFEDQPLSAVRAQPALRRRMNMIFQDPYASLNPRWRVRDIVAEPLRAFGIARSRNEIAGRVGELLRQVGLAACRRREIPARILRRPAPAHLDRPRAVLRAGVSGLRRADQRARCLGAGADPQPDARPAAQARPDLSVHQPQPRGGAPRLRSARRDVSRPDRRARPGRGDLSPRRAIPIRGCCSMRSPISSMIGRSRTPVGGEVPSPIAPPPGCPFHPRCPLANARCRAEKPNHTRDEDVLVACHAVEEKRNTV